jgi:hypothetical protein
MRLRYLALSFFILVGVQPVISCSEKQGLSNIQLFIFLGIFAYGLHGITTFCLDKGKFLYYYLYGDYSNNLNENDRKDAIKKLFDSSIKKKKAVDKSFTVADEWIDSMVSNLHIWTEGMSVSLVNKKLGPAFVLGSDDKIDVHGLPYNPGNLSCAILTWHDEKRASSSKICKSQLSSLKERCLISGVNLDDFYADWTMYTPEEIRKVIAGAFAEYDARPKLRGIEYSLSNYFKQEHLKIKKEIIDKKIVMCETIYKQESDYELVEKNLHTNTKIMSFSADTFIKEYKKNLLDLT